MKDTAPSSYYRSPPERSTCFRCGAEFERFGQSRICPPCRRPRSATPRPKPGTALSFRERQLVSLLTRGHRNKEIAERLLLTEGTIKEYINRLFHKTGARSRHDLVMLVVQDRLRAIETRLILVQQETAAMPAGDYGRPNVPELAGEALKLIQELRRCGEPCESPSPQ